MRHMGKQSTFAHKTGLSTSTVSRALDEDKTSARTLAQLEVSIQQIEAAHAERRMKGEGSVQYDYAGGPERPPHAHVPPQEGANGMRSLAMHRREQAPYEAQVKAQTYLVFCVNGQPVQRRALGPTEDLGDIVLDASASLSAHIEGEK